MTIVVGTLKAEIAQLETRPAQTVQKRRTPFLSEDALAIGERANYCSDSLDAGRLGQDLPLTTTDTLSTTFVRVHPAHVEPAGPVTDHRRLS